MSVHDGHNTGTVDVDPFDRRVVLEWLDDGVLMTRASLAPSVAVQYAVSIINAATDAMTAARVLNGGAQ